MNPFIIFRPFKAALRWIVGVEDRDILTPFERSLFGKDGEPKYYGDCTLCETEPDSFEVTIGPFPIDCDGRKP